MRWSTTIMPTSKAGGGAPGLMGRQVAGRGVPGGLPQPRAVRGAGGLGWPRRRRRRSPNSGAIIRSRAAGLGPCDVLERGKFHRTFFPDPPATIIHSPQPPDPEFAWARQQAGPHAFALSGVTHTLCSPEAVGLLHGLVTAPFEPYDALICTSRAVASMVREITGAYTDHLRGRLGGSWPRTPLG